MTAKTRAIGLRLLAFGTLVVLSGCLPAGATDQGRAIRSLYDIVFVVAVAVFLIVEGLIVWSVIRYRRRPGDDELPPQIHGDTRAEIVWTVIPLVIVLAVFFLSWQTLDAVQAKVAPAVTVEVTAFQWQWQFTYPENNVTVLGTFEKPAEMVVPVNEPILIKLRAADVIHAFYVPAFNFKLDAIPGIENSFEFTPRELGVFRGQCAELCGLYHDRMLLTVRVVTRPEYDAWLRAAAASPSPSVSNEPSGSTEPPGSSGGAPAPSVDIIRISAKNIAFDQPQLTAAAGRPFSLVFSNQDAVPHNVAIYTDPSASTAVFTGEIFPGPAERTYSVPALKAGSYFFRCDVHPTQMTGTLVVQ